MTYEDYKKAAEIVRKYNDQIKSITDECTAELSAEFKEEFIPECPTKIKPIFIDYLSNKERDYVKFAYSIGAGMSIGEVNIDDTLISVIFMEDNGSEITAADIAHVCGLGGLGINFNGNNFER